MKNFLLSVVFFGWVIVLPNLALAHTDEYLATVEAPHGGQLRAAGPFHLELVAKDGELRLYVTDHMDNKILTKGGSGKANILGKDGKRTSVELTPVFSNMMRGTGDFQIAPDTVVSVFVALDGYETQGARFTSSVQESSTGEEEEGSSHEHHHHEHDNGGDDNNRQAAEEDNDEDDED
jgi:hypothetical protein